MTNRKTKFLPVFLIACLCLVASLGFASVNAFADNCESTHNGDYKVMFTLDNLYFGRIEGAKELVSDGNDTILTNADDPTFKIAKSSSMAITEIKAVPSEYYSFDHWKRSDGKDFQASITDNVNFTAYFKLKPGYVNIRVDATSFPEEAGGIWTVPVGSTWHFNYSVNGLKLIQVIYDGKIVASFRPKYGEFVQEYGGREIHEGDVIISSATLSTRWPWPH